MSSPFGDSVRSLDQEAANRVVCRVFLSQTRAAIPAARRPGPSPAGWLLPPFRANLICRQKSRRPGNLPGARSGDRWAEQWRGEKEVTRVLLPCREPVGRATELECRVRVDRQSHGPPARGGNANWTRAVRNPCISGLHDHGLLTAVRRRGRRPRSAHFGRPALDPYRGRGGQAQQREHGGEMSSSSVHPDPWVASQGSRSNAPRPLLGPHALCMQRPFRDGVLDYPLYSRQM